MSAAFTILIAHTALAFMPSQSATLDAKGLESLVKGLGYENRQTNDKVDSEKWEIIVTTPNLRVPMGVEISASKRYIWLTANLGDAPTNAASLELLKQNGKIQPSFFYVTASNRLNMGIAIENRAVDATILKRNVDKLAADLDSTRDLWLKKSG